MPRISRAVAVGYAHHITQRGNYGQRVFEGSDDYQQYLQWLVEYCQKYCLKVWTYCLMSNHVHFVGVPMKDDTFAKVFNTLHMRYSQYFNQKKNTKGHLWQGRFYSTILDTRHLQAAIRYVENNPVRAKLVGKACEYEWSSARAHVYSERSPLLSDDCYLVKEISDWESYLGEKDDGALVTSIRQNTRTGHPCGGESFVKDMESLLKRKLMRTPVGRPRVKL